MTKFTPGPWNIHPTYQPIDNTPTICQDFDALTISIAKGEMLIGEVDAYKPKDGYSTGFPRVADYDETRANAHLIVAAPEMYAALANIVRYEQDPEFREHAERHASEATGGNVSAWQAFVLAAESALEKAAGLVSDPPEEPRCSGRVAVKMPYDSCPSETILECRRSESECDGDHDFEKIQGARYGEPYYPTVATGVQHVTAENSEAQIDLPF